MTELETLKEEIEKNVAMVNYLKGYIKGLEERLVRLEQANQYYQEKIRQGIYSATQRISLVFQDFGRPS